MKYTSPYFVAIEVSSLTSYTGKTESGWEYHKPLQKTGTAEKGFYSHNHNISGKVVGLSVHSGNMPINNTKSFPLDPDEEQYIYTKGNPIEVEIGDKVYFNYLNVITPRILESLEGEKRVIAVPYHDLYCKVIGDELVTLNHYLMYESYHGTDIEDHEVDGLGSIKGRLLKIGELELIVPRSGRMIGHGKVISCGTGIKGSELHGVEKDDLVLVHKKREQEIEIEGKLMFVTWNSNAFAKVVDGEVIPIGKYTTIKPHKPKIHTSLYVPETALSNEKITDGTVTAVGADCNGEVLIGDKVRYNEYIEFEGYEEFIVYQGQIMLRYD